MGSILKLIIFFPLMSGVINGVLCKKLSNITASLIASITIILVAVGSLYIFYVSGIQQQVVHITLFTWIKIQSFSINWSLYVDQLTAIMLLLITIVSAVVHIYSLGYMADDKNLPKFLSYLSLFTFFMMVLVSADNFLQLFCGWEGVGLCSYLLIGYYYTKDSANNAAIKAFIVNRIGDFAFIIAILLIALYSDSFEFKHVFATVEHLSQIPKNILGLDLSLLDIICFMLFFGCMGKSAQIGLHIWLPDAMEGPTPVSALIHAATMVTAGVFLVVRCSFMFEYSPIVLQFITIIGSVTCLFAALIAITQKDIKKIIAYSTCSQLGYMFLACGVSAYHAGMFHLVTHGFFKALLFLSAGNVIHACGQQDIFKLGGLRCKLPMTYANFWVGSLAIIGIFPFAGFYSKDLILESAYLSGGYGIFASVSGIIAAGLTAIYSLKIIILTFHGKTKLDQKIFNNIRQSQKIMNLPLLVLVAGTLFSGMFGAYILNISILNGFFSGVILNLHAYYGPHLSLVIQLLPMIIGVMAVLFGAYIYMKNISGRVTPYLQYLYYILRNKLFFDEIFYYIFVRTVRVLGQYSRKFDTNILDRFGPNTIAVLVNNFGRVVTKIQTGYISNYMLYITLVVVVYITLFITLFTMHFIDFTGVIKGLI